MQKTEYSNGDSVTELFEAKTEKETKAVLKKAYIRSMDDPRRVKRIIQQRMGRNDICLCGSGRKFKKCCIHKQATLIESAGGQ